MSQRFPAEEKISDVRASLARNRSVIFAAPPGSGKTTCIPPALLGEPWLKGRKIVMLEPRRIAARSCAEFIASKLGENVGETVGYQVRLERRVSQRTRLEIVTEGLLAQRIMSDPELSDVGLIIFDEFHERSLACDLSFALALDVRRALRDDLRILVMSATLDAESVARHLGGSDTILAEGRMFPVETRYLGDVSPTAAVMKALSETSGDILCFLPGEGEIRRACETLGRTAADLPRTDILPLYGSLPKEEQDRVFRSDGRRKVILSTSIAETSVTIPGIECVVDSGLMRIPRFSPATGMSGLVTVPLSRDRAEQRRGRAGRVRAGVCYRLWEAGMDAARPERMNPEILDADLASLVLSSCAWGALKRDGLPWMTPPPASAWDQAVGLLKLLGALDADGRLTPKGEAMSHLPMHPRLANMMMGCGVNAASRETASILAAIIEEGSKSRETDIRRILDEVRETPNRPSSSRILRLAKRFEGVRIARVAGVRECASEGAMLALAYPDRIAKSRGNGSFTMVCGKGMAVDRLDPLAKSQFVVGCELDDRIGDARLFLGCPIDGGEVEDLFADEMSSERVCEWDRRADRVKSVARRRLGAVAFEEKSVPAEGGEMSEAALDAMMEGVRLKGVENLPCWTKESLQMRSRIAFLSRAVPEGGWPAADDAQVMDAMRGFVSGMTKWKDLDRLDMSLVLSAVIAEAGHDRRELDRLAPVRMEVPSGSNMLVHYEGDEPTVEVRLQECFGLMETPKVAGGRVPIVMTLLSPAQRPVQITKDIAGFWREGYQLVRKDMRGRYPKHYWPEDPFTAVATRRVRPPA